MQVSGATDLASKGQGLSDSSTAKFKEELEDSYNDTKIRCPCASTLQTETMIKVLPNKNIYIFSLFDSLLGACFLPNVGNIRQLLCYFSFEPYLEHVCIK